MTDRNMTDNRTTELPRLQLHRLLEKHDVGYWCAQQTTFWNGESGSEFLAYQYQVNGVYKLAFKGVNITPEQAIAATLGVSNESVKALIDDMLDFISNCCETTLDSNCCDPVDCKYIDGDGELVECTRYQDFLSRAKAIAATLGGGKLTAEQVREIVEKHWHNLPAEYDMPEATALPEYSYDWQAIADELNAALGGGECELKPLSALDVTFSMLNEIGWGTCTECGFAVPMEAKFCNECGKAVKR